MWLHVFRFNSLHSFNFNVRNKGKLLSFCRRIYTAAVAEISIKSRVKYTKKIR
jgi:hypothetical protein